MSLPFHLQVSPKLGEHTRERLPLEMWELGSCFPNNTKKQEHFQHLPIVDFSHLGPCLVPVFLYQINWSQNSKPACTVYSILYILHSGGLEPSRARKINFKLHNRYFQAIHKLQWTHITHLHKSVHNPAMCALSVLFSLQNTPLIWLTAKTQP